MVLQRIFSIAHKDAYAPCPSSLPSKNQFPHNITEYKNMVIRWDKIQTVFRIKENLLLQCSICFNSHLCHVTCSSHDAKQPVTAIFCVYCNEQVSIPLQTYHAPLLVHNPSTVCPFATHCTQIPLSQVIIPVRAIYSCHRRWCNMQIHSQYPTCVPYQCQQTICPLEPEH